MHNVLQILRRDFKRLVTVPAAWVIMIGLILIPPLYAWFNIYGFWNPYGNTDSIKVAVANMDEGTDNALLGKVNLGDQIEGTLKSNDQLGWEFMAKPTRWKRWSRATATPQSSSLPTSAKIWPTSSPTASIAPRSNIT